MHEMVIYGVSFDMVGKQPIVLLKTVSGNRFLPIWIGHPEAASILAKLQESDVARPMTHDLLAQILGEVDVRVVKVTVTDLKDSTYYALITLDCDSRVIEVDSRPSDAIALAVRANAPIFAADHVVESSSVDFENDAAVETDEMVEKFKEFLDTVNPDDFIV